MSIENTMFFFVGIAFILLSIRSFIFIIRGGGIDIAFDMWFPYWKPKENATKNDQGQFVLRAIMFLIAGVAFIYAGLFLTLPPRG